MKKKVQIIIEASDKFYAMVGFMASTYGRGGHADNEEEVEKAILNCKAWILREGDIPVVVDKRITLARWI